MTSVTSYTPYSQKFYVVCEGRTLLEYTHVFGHVDIRKGTILLLERADGVALRFIVEDVVCGLTPGTRVSGAKGTTSP